MLLIIVKNYYPAVTNVIAHILWIIYRLCEITEVRDCKRIVQLIVIVTVLQFIPFKDNIFTTQKQYSAAHIYWTVNFTTYTHCK